MEKKVYRIIDANYNRAREGMRVCEDILRFFCADAGGALVLKKARRKLAQLINDIDIKILISERDTICDSGKFKLVSGSRKISAPELLRRNFQRITESLRVLEEVSQLFSPNMKLKFMKQRFLIYALEKKIFAKV